MLIIFLSISVNICFGAQKSSLIETVLFSTYNLSFGFSKTTHFYLKAFSSSTYQILRLACVSNRSDQTPNSALISELMTRGAQ